MSVLRALYRTTLERVGALRRRRERCHALEDQLARAAGLVCAGAMAMERDLTDTERLWLSQTAKLLPDFEHTASTLSFIVREHARGS